MALNLSPGPRLMIDEPQIFRAVAISIYLGNLVLLMLNLSLIPFIAMILSVPRTFPIPFILFFTLLNACIVQNNATELLLVGLGVVATLFEFAECPLAPLPIGFILGLLLTNDFLRAMPLCDGVSFNWERPMTLGLLVLAAVLTLMASSRARRAGLCATGMADGT